MYKTWSSSSRNISKSMERTLSRDSLYDIELIYAPDESWYMSLDEASKYLTDQGKTFVVKSCTGWIHNPCMYIKAKYTGIRGEKDIIIITDRVGLKTKIFYIDK